ncbi:MAG: DUF2093 domain-containing protein [Rhizobiales bacterium]|nr:DUF2093 domain-containing protein [Hyphomicrobiales bacterium]
MNRFNTPLSGGEAKLRYDHADFHVISPGSFVRCAVTSLPIPIDDLKYWSVARQEAYVDVAASLSRHLEISKA